MLPSIFFFLFKDVQNFVSSFFFLLVNPNFFFLLLLTTNYHVILHTSTNFNFFWCIYYFGPNQRIIRVMCSPTCLLKEVRGIIPILVSFHVREHDKIIVARVADVSLCNFCYNLQCGEEVLAVELMGTFLALQFIENHPLRILFLACGRVLNVMDD